VHAAFGEPRYPATLGDRVARRLAAPARSRDSGRYRIAAALVAILVTIALVLGRLAWGPPSGFAPAPAFKSNQTVGAVDPDAKLPPEDLQAADLSGPVGDLVTPLNLSAVSNGRTVSLIGAYADTARIVLFFRSAPGSMAGHAEIYDRTGLLNNGMGGSGSSRTGDSILILMAGAHPDARGIAHLNVAVDQYSSEPGDTGGTGTWNFSFDLKVQLPDKLAMRPPLASIGPWPVTMEAMEATPAVVRFQAVVKGASPSQVTSSMVTLVDSSGHEVQRSSEYSELINQMFFFLVIGTPETRINVTWTRPPAGTYELRISAHGSDYRAMLVIPPGPG